MRLYKNIPIAFPALNTRGIFFTSFFSFSAAIKVYLTISSSNPIRSSASGEPLLQKSLNTSPMILYLSPKYSCCSVSLAIFFTSFLVSYQGYHKREGIASKKFKFNHISLNNYFHFLYSQQPMESIF